MTAIPTNNTLLTAANLNKTVQVGEQSLAIIKDVSIHVDAGEFVVIMGKSGSGKSTLLGLLAALDYPDSGSVKLGEQTLSSLDEDKLAAIRQREMGFVFQSFHLLPTLTVSENIAFPLDIARRPDNARVDELIDAVGLGHRRDSLPNQLSGGEQQRVALARAFASRPRILFADEPTGNLDTVTGKTINDLLFQLNREEGTTLVLVTHEATLASRCHRRVTLEGGQLVENDAALSGTPG